MRQQEAAIIDIRPRRLIFPLHVFIRVEAVVQKHVYVSESLQQRGQFGAGVTENERPAMSHALRHEIPHFKSPLDLSVLKLIGRPYRVIGRTEALAHGKSMEYK